MVYKEWHAGKQRHTKTESLVGLLYNLNQHFIRKTVTVNVKCGRVGSRAVDRERLVNEPMSGTAAAATTLVRPFVKWTLDKLQGNT